MSLRAASNIFITVACADAISFEADILALKHAQALYGVDEAVVLTLESNGNEVRKLLPPPAGFRILSSKDLLGVHSVLFIGVKDLRSFNYQQIRGFAQRVLNILAGQAPGTRHVGLTLHGPGYGLDESEAFKAEVAGLLDAIAEKDYPESLEQITIIERNRARADRLSKLLEALHGPDTQASLNTRSDTLQILEGVGSNSGNKDHIFVAMPFASDFDDLFHYGIQNAVNTAGYLCERADLASFTGDILIWVKERIASASLLVADLSTANPNVYLEVGYAWGKGIPTILLSRDPEALKFDVRGQRCIIYSSIRQLEESLRKELPALSLIRSNPA